MNLKHSRQRDSIKEFLQGRKDHPTAAVVYENVRKTIPNISLGTVYRNLTLLADIGEISRIHVGDGVDHFDADISPHYHFICRECGNVMDMDMDKMNLEKAAGRNFGGEIEYHTICFYGKCEKCCCKTSIQKKHNVTLC